MEINVDQKLHSSFRHHLSRTSKITNLQKHTNYGKAGHFAFGIASEDVTQPFGKSLSSVSVCHMYYILDWKEKNIYEQASLL